VIIFRVTATVIAILLVGAITLTAQQPIQVQWSTYLGGSGRDEARDVDCDNDENAYVCGVFNSLDFPAPRGVSGPQDSAGPGYVAKFAPDGTLMWLMWLRGFSPHEVAVSENGLVVICGSADVGANTLGGTQSGLVGSTDVGIVLVAPNGERLASMTIGGTRDDIGTSIDIIGDRIYVAGITVSTDLPTTPNAPQRTYGGGGSLGQGIGDGVVAKLVIDRSGPSVRVVPEIVSYYGGRYLDEILCIRKRNTLGEVYLGGRTRSDNLAGSRYISSSRSGDVFNDDGFIARLDSNLRPVWHMYLGGSGNDVVYDVLPRIEYDQSITNSAVSLTACGVYNGGSFLNPVRSFPVPADPPYAGGSQFGGDAFAIQTSGFSNSVRWLQVISTPNDDVSVALPRNGSLYGLPLVFSNGAVGPFVGARGFDAYLWAIEYRGNRDEVERYQGDADECILDADFQRFGYGGRALRLGSRGEYFCGSTNSTTLPGTSVQDATFQRTNRGGIDGYIVRTGCSNRRPQLVANDSVFCSEADTALVTFLYPTATAQWPDGSQGQAYVARGAGVVRVRYTTIGGCSEFVDSVIIRSGIVPQGVLGPSDTIELCKTDSALIWVSGKYINSVVWSGGEKVNDTTIRVTAPGTYTATIASEDGCTVTTNAVTVVSSQLGPGGNVRVEILNKDSIYVGDTLLVLVRLDVPPNTDITTLPVTWSASLRFDRWLFFPARPLTRGVTDDSSRIVSVAGTRAATSDTLGILALRVALGDTDTTDIILDSLQFFTCSPLSSPIKIGVRIAGICQAGGTKRFVTTARSQARVVVAPNPVSGNGATVTATGDDLQQVTARVVDLLGQSIELVGVEPIDGEHAWLLPSWLPSGRYVVMVQTPTVTSTANFEVVR
jgi:hypothetical protein